MRGLFGELQLANIAEMDCLLFMFFSANARSFWGVAAGEHCRDGLPAFLCFFARMRGLFGELQLANIAEMDWLPVFMCFWRECAVTDLVIS